jgi:RNA polymerase primary sigma factor
MPYAYRPVATGTPLDAYLSEINATALLDADAEHELARRVQEGDPAARDHLVRANLRLVVRLARGYAGKGLDLPDLIAEGNLGLLRAVEGFDPDLDTRFSTYASFWIKQSIQKALMSAAPTVRLPTYLHHLLNVWRRTAAQLERDLGRPPSEAEIGGRLGLPPNKRKLIRKALRLHGGRMHGPGADAGDFLHAELADNTTVSPLAALTRSEDEDQMLRLVAALPPREAAVVRLRFGLAGEEPLTLREIGARLGLTRERVRQIEREVLDRLAEQLGTA